MFLETEVLSMSVDDRSITEVHTSRGTMSAALVINAAGLYADKVANMAGDYSFVIRPRKGEEYLLDKRLSGLVRSTIFPLPTKVSKGILVIPTVHGNLMLGPTAEETDDREDLSTSLEGFQQIFAMCTTMVDGLQPSDLIATFAGLRPASDRDDFVTGHRRDGVENSEGHGTRVWACRGRERRIRWDPAWRATLPLHDGRGESCGYCRGSLVFKDCLSLRTSHRS